MDDKSNQEMDSVERTNQEDANEDHSKDDSSNKQDDEKLLNEQEDQKSSNEKEGQKSSNEQEPEQSELNEEQRRSNEEKELTEEQLSDKLNKSIKLKDEGNQHFKNKEFEESLQFYNRSLDECPIKFEDKRSIILYNRGVCKFKLLEASSTGDLDFKDEKVKLRFDDIIQDLTRSIELNSTYFKPVLKRAELYSKHGGDRLDNSLQDYKKVLELIQNDKANEKWSNEIKYEIVKLEKQIEERNEKLKQEMFGQLKNLGNLFLRPFGLSTENFKLQQNENGGYSVNFQQ